ncbi:uncharacterized protein [Epargyreus clarus]|uniref:uncharacterized protein n=1 Tax=Epargyreus clarus TaxID=520877 RepID=UPI003C2CA898
MVLSALFSNNRYGLCSDRIDNDKQVEDLRDLSSSFFVKLCKACQLNNMAALPPSAFSAGRIRETQRDMKISNIRKGSEPMKFFNTNLTELSPLKYNSKLMNSIWGIYNRYSPHNVKKINDAPNFSSAFQQTAVNSGNKNETMLTIPGANLDNMWTVSYASQSH